MSADAITSNPRLDNIAGLIPLEALNIQTYSAGEAFEDRTGVKCIFPDLLVLVKQVVHFPKLALHTRCFGGMCGGERVWVHLR